MCKFLTFFCSAVAERWWHCLQRFSNLEDRCTLIVPTYCLPLCFCLRCTCANEPCTVSRLLIRRLTLGVLDQPLDLRSRLRKHTDQICTLCVRVRRSNRQRGFALRKGALGRNGALGIAFGRGCRCVHRCRWRCSCSHRCSRRRCSYQQCCNRILRSWQFRTFQLRGG